MPPKQAKLKTEDSNSGDSPWRSRFPVARIKKIMQADEDVGKVAQVVPVIISKAVELFMASMIDEASRHAIETGHKRVLPGHLKLAVRGNKTFDFLEPNIENLVDPIHVEARPIDDKKPKRSRARKAPDAETAQQGVPDQAESSATASMAPPQDDHPVKRVKTEETGSSASRSMSIANMISPSSDS